MKKYVLSIACCMLIVLIAGAQNKTKASEKYSTTLNTGLLEGSGEKSFGQLQLINGLQKNAWFAGIGIGIDYYGKKEVYLCLRMLKWILEKAKPPPLFMQMEDIILAG
jgi:hypothetical protein